jgi:Mg-chelatase subunit ChlD
VERPAARPRDGRRPLARRPKQLTDKPTLFGGGSGGWTALSQPGRPPGQMPPGRGQVQMGEDPAQLSVRPMDGDGADAAVRASAREIAARLAIPRPRRDRRTLSARGRVASVPYRGHADELDLERTLEVLAELPAPRDEDLVVRQPLSARRSVVLVVDVSGSMKGERIRTAAATIGAVAAELARERLGVLAFWSDAAMLLPLGAPVRPLELVDDLLRIPARGLTNVAFPLELAAQQLRGVPTRDARVILLSDCVHNAGPDPRPLAARLPRVDVLADVTGERDLDLAADIARAGRGRLRLIRSHRDVAPALAGVFAS